MSRHLDLLRYGRKHALRCAKWAKHTGKPAAWVKVWINEARTDHRQIMRR